MKYAAKRIAMLLFTMVIVSLLAFVAFDVISGDPATAMLGTQATPERVAELRAELGLDRPLLVRYGEWLLGFFTGNLGTSYSYHQPVWELIAPKVGVTLCLSLLSFALIAVISVPLGVRSATRRSQGILSGAETLFNQLCMAVPPFFHRHFADLLLQHRAALVRPRQLSRAWQRLLRKFAVPALRGGVHRHPPDRHDGADAAQHHCRRAGEGLCPYGDLPGQ